ncbi:MAG: ferrochelatase [Granulosicoccaceae bacterium]
MKYTGTPEYQHGTREKLGVLLINLGTPDAPNTPSVRRYLAQFLNDPRIIEMPKVARKLLLHGVILRVRPSRSAEAYEEVWSKETGSPLLHHSLNQKQALHAVLQSELGENVIVELGMRYGSPSIASALQTLAKQNVRHLLVLPMYPQYSGTTTASVFDAVSSELQRTRWLPELRFINQYFNYPGYIEVLAQSIEQSWADNGRGQLLVTSYHGIPRRYLLNGDPYHCHCHMTTRLLAEKLGLKEHEYRVVFQSRVGREEWLKPYCDETMKQLPGEGIKNIDVVSPAFSSDCLETIEEISGENCEYFMENGGEKFNYIECLNDTPSHIEFLSSLVQQHMQGWPIADKAVSETSGTELQATAKRAQALLDKA